MQVCVQQQDGRGQNGGFVYGERVRILFHVTTGKGCGVGSRRGLGWEGKKKEQGKKEKIAVRL